jgi:hypothetical protein
MRSSHTSGRYYELNSDAVALGKLDLADPEDLGRQFLTQLDDFPRASPGGCDPIQRRISMNQITFALCALLALAEVDTPGWNGTKWGQTVSEVSEQLPGASPVANPQASDGLEGLLALDAFELGGVSYSVVLYFNPSTGGLQRVSLSYETTIDLAATDLAAGTVDLAAAQKQGEELFAKALADAEAAGAPDPYEAALRAMEAEAVAAIKKHELEVAARQRRASAGSACATVDDLIHKKYGPPTRNIHDGKVVAGLLMVHRHWILPTTTIRLLSADSVEVGGTCSIVYESTQSGEMDKI